MIDQMRAAWQRGRAFGYQQGLLAAKRCKCDERWDTPAVELRIRMLQIVRDARYLS